MDRDIAEERIFPAINIKESGTRKDELLHPLEEIDKINEIRRKFLQLDKVAAVAKMKQMMEKYESNEELLRGL